MFKLFGTIAINSSVADETIDATMEKVDNLNRSLQGSSQQANSTARYYGSGSALSRAWSGFGRTAEKIGKYVFDFGKKWGTAGFEYNSMMEQYKAEFKTMRGWTEEEANAFMQELETFAIDTPLQLADIASGASTLFGSGFKDNEIIPTLQMLGDVVLGDTDKFQRMIKAFSQVDMFGKLRAQEAYQMLDSMVPIYELLSNYYGVDESAIPDMQKNGAISAKDVALAMSMATSETGRYFNAMDIKMGTWAGQVEKITDLTQKTAGAFTLPFFEEAKSEVLPQMYELLTEFNGWITENQTTLSEWAEFAGNATTKVLGGALDAFKYVVENQEAVSAAFTAITGALVTGLVKAHPYISALTLVAGWFGYSKDLDKQLQQTNFDEYVTSGPFGLAEPYSDEDKRLLQDWIDASKEYNAFASDDANSYQNIFGARQWRTDEAKKQGDALIEKINEAKKIVDEANPVIRQNYQHWLDYKDKEAGEDLGYLDVVVEISDDSEGNMQSQLDSMDLNATVDVTANLAPYYNAISSIKNNMIQGAMQGLGSMYYSLPDGVPSHAKGLDFVPRDGYLARLHYGEAVLNRSTADMLRGGGMGNTSRVEALLQDVLSGIRQIAGNTSTGQTLALDTGVLVGQITPMIDRRLGTISNRKGRG